MTHQDLELILTAVISACAACRWPGEGFDRKRFVESLIRFGSQELHLDHVSTGALLELGVISDSQTPWGEFGQKCVFLLVTKSMAEYPTWLSGTLRYLHAI